MTPHDAIDALLAGHALGDLDEEERQQLTLLLLQHPELRQRLEEFRTTLELLPLALPETEPAPEGVRHRPTRTLRCSFCSHARATRGMPVDMQHVIAAAGASPAATVPAVVPTLNAAAPPSVGSPDRLPYAIGAPSPPL